MSSFAFEDLARSALRGLHRSMEFEIQERLRHLFIIGKTGTGKSTYQEDLMYDDIRENRGFCLIDPHGASAKKILDAIPRKRKRDIRYFDPLESPIAFNPLISSDNNALVASELLAIMKYQWWPKNEYPFTEWALLHALATLLERQQSTLADLRKLFNNTRFRNKAVDMLRDKTLVDFWTDFETLSKKDQQEATRSILNKIGQFLLFPEIRKIICTPPKLDLVTTMDTNRILIINLNKGRIGRKAMRILGGFFLTSFATAAYARKETNPFFLYVDECHNFPSFVFEELVSEVRKFNLGITLSSQSLSQIPETTKEAILGNVANIVAFRVGPDDARVLAPIFETDEFIHDRQTLKDIHLGAFHHTKLGSLKNYHAWIKRDLDNSIEEIRTLPGLPPVSGRYEQNLAASRAAFGI